MVASRFTQRPIGLETEQE